MVLEQYLTVSLSDFKRAGLFQRGKRVKALFEWKRGEDYASLTAVTDATGFVTFAVLSFYYNGEPVEQSVTLYWYNLYNGGGYYFFGCPVSGLACRKLYFSPDRRQFIGRVATGAVHLYNLRKKEMNEIQSAPYRWQLINNEPRAVEF